MINELLIAFTVIELIVFSWRVYADWLLIVRRKNFDEHEMKILRSNWEIAKEDAKAWKTECLRMAKEIENLKKSPSQSERGE